MIEIIEAFVLLLVIMDPLLSASVLLGFTKGNKNIDLNKIAMKSTAIALCVFLAFLFFGNDIFSAFGISIDSFKIAGGMVLLLLGIQAALGIHLPKEDDEVSEIAVIIGTPLIAGPATIAITVILAKDIGLLFTLIAGLSALFVTFLTLMFANNIVKFFGKSSIHFLSTMMGIITIAWGVQFILTGATAFLSSLGTSAV